MEFAELDGITKRTDVSALKAFLSVNVDLVRPPYGKKALKLARGFTFGASVNSSAFLNDPTGSRRFVCLSIKQPIDIQWLRANRDLLWAQIKEDTDIERYISGEMQIEQERINEKFKYIDSDVEAITDFISRLSDTDLEYGAIDLKNGYHRPLTLYNIAWSVYGEGVLRGKSVDTKIANKIRTTLKDRLDFDYKNKKIKGETSKVFIKKLSDE